MMTRKFVFCALAMLVLARAHAAEGDLKTVLAAPAASSAAFCLFELPNSGGDATQRMINLGIVQYIELASDELRISYGGGNLGSGHEARLPIKTREEGLAIILRMQRAAHDCK